MTLTKEQLDAQITEKDAERIACIKQIETDSKEIQALNEKIQECQRRLKLLNDRSLAIKVEVEQIEQLKAMLE